MQNRTSRKSVHRNSIFELNPINLERVVAPTANFPILEPRVLIGPTLTDCPASIAADEGEMETAPVHCILLPLTPDSSSNCTRYFSRVVFLISNDLCEMQAEEYKIRIRNSQTNLWQSLYSGGSFCGIQPKSKVNRAHALVA